MAPAPKANKFKPAEPAAKGPKINNVFHHFFSNLVMKLIKIYLKAKVEQRPSATIKRTTANSNKVAVTSTSVAPAPKAKKAKPAKPAMQIQDEDDDTYEEEAALASPLKGSESRKINNVFHQFFLI